MTELISPFLSCGMGSLLWVVLAPILIPFGLLICLSLASLCLPATTPHPRNEPRGFEVLPADHQA
jgi:hypothetical protein